ITNAKLGDYSARAEIGSASQEFGQASAYVGSSTTLNTNRFANVEMPSFQVMANNVSPYLTNMTVGNLFVDYSPYVFSPVFGYKGLSVEGDYDRFNYHAFALKHVLNSFTAGTRARGIWPNFKLTGYGVYWEQNARLANPAAVSGNTLTTAPSSVIELRRVAQDLVYNLDGEYRLLADRVTLQGIYGINRYSQSASVDYTDPFNPTFGLPLDKTLSPTGEMARGKIESNGLLWKGLNTAYSYRDMGTEYKPHYRQNPMSFDDTESDQWGHNVRLTQFHKGWVFSNEYDTLRRHSMRRYFRHRYTWGVGHYGYKGMDIAFSQEIRREIYAFASDRSNFTTDKNEQVVGNELYVRTQLSPRMAFWVKPRQEHVRHPATNRRFVTDSLQTKLEFYITTNARLFAEHKVTRFGDKTFEPQGYPFDDNFTRVSFEVTF
ncbi:MAG TPA: hypothetical protein P5079_11115, partial [Elusimicrobiota bacterium]|nr:hypothetical protein [Elusimicrobiota bacterium]